jgi:adenine-specific DNA-methyltransferase
MARRRGKKTGSADNVLPFKRRGKDTAALVECEDNLKFMRRLASGSMKLIVTSPPYNIGKEYEEPLSQEHYVEEQAACIAEAVRLLHPQGSICWQVGNHIQSGEVFPLDVILYPLFKNHRLQLRNRIVWTFGHGLHCQKRFSGRHETILWFTKARASAHRGDRGARYDKRQEGRQLVCV